MSAAQFEGVPAFLAQPASDLYERGHDQPHAVGLLVNTLRGIAAGKLGSPSFELRNRARERITEWSVAKKHVSPGLRTAIEEIESGKAVLSDDDVLALIEAVDDRRDREDSMVLVLDNEDGSGRADSVVEAARKLVGDGDTGALLARLFERKTHDEATVEVLGPLAEAVRKRKQPAVDTRRAAIPAVRPASPGEALSAAGKGPFNEQAHPRAGKGSAGGGKFVSKGGGGSSGTAKKKATAPAQIASPGQIQGALTELGWDDLAAFQKHNGLVATGKIDAVTWQMMKEQVAKRNAGPEKGEVVLSGDQPSKESGPAHTPEPPKRASGRRAVTRAKGKKRAGKPKQVKEYAVTGAGTVTAGSAVGVATAWGGAIVPLVALGRLGDPPGDPAARTEYATQVSDLLGLAHEQLTDTVEARKAAYAVGDTAEFTKLRAREQHLREQLAEAEAKMDSLQEVKSSAYPGLDRSPKENWVDRAGGLPKYIERIAKHLHYEKGRSISAAIATAVNVVKKMCASGDLNFPGKQSVNPKSRAEACKAVADWERKKASAKVKEAVEEIVEAARAEGAHYYPTIEECVEIVEGAEAMDFDAHPPLRESAMHVALGIGMATRARERSGGRMFGWDSKKHPRNRLGEFTDVLSKLTKGEKYGVKTGRGRGGGMLPRTFLRPSGSEHALMRDYKGREERVHVGRIHVPALGQSVNSTSPPGLTTSSVDLSKHAEEDLKQKPLYEIAAMIRKEWKKPNFAAAPYLQAMGGMSSHTENYGMDSGKSIIAYFLSNASSFRGEHAKRIKAELKRRLKESGDSSLVSTLDRLEEAVEDRIAAQASGDALAFTIARAREQGVREAVLTAAARKKLKPSAFAIPPDRYPIHDEAHARNALSRVAQHGSEEEKKKVRAAVKRRYPHIGED